MIKRLLLIFAAAVTISNINVNAQKHDWAQFARYEQANKEAAVSQIPSKRLVVFLGN